MLREYQTNYEYQSFLRIWEARLDSSQRLQIKGILKPAYEKLKLLNLDPMMNILSVRYSEYGRPAVNQPQIFRSFILLFLLSDIGVSRQGGLLPQVPLRSGRAAFPHPAPYEIT